jgi:hypothetical protein
MPITYLPDADNPRTQLVEQNGKLVFAVNQPSLMDVVADLAWEHLHGFAVQNDRGSVRLTMGVKGWGAGVQPSTAVWMEPDAVHELIEALQAALDEAVAYEKEAPDVEFDLAAALNSTSPKGNGGTRNA